MPGGAELEHPVSALAAIARVTKLADAKSVLLLPWQFSPTVVGGLVLAAALYGRGARGMGLPASQRTAFYLGLLVIYCALQTRWEYYASHMIFVLQLQHFALHDVAPVLLAWSAPHSALARGLPRRTSFMDARYIYLRTHKLQRSVRAAARVLLNPFIAVTVYVLALLVWLWPPLTFDVMLNNGLYRLMSWSVLAGALPFWSLVLDARPWPLARLKPGHRLVMLHFAMLPIVLAGAALSLSERNLYPVYAVCGRFLPIPPVSDQQLGGVVMWVLGAAIFALVFFIVLGRNLEQEEAELSARRLAGQSW